MEGRQIHTEGFADDQRKPPCWSYERLTRHALFCIQLLEIANEHTSYLSFLLHRQDFLIPNFYTQKQCKTPENYNKYPQKV